MPDTTQNLVDQLAQCEDLLTGWRRTLRSLGLPTGLLTVYAGMYEDMFTTKDGTISLYKRSLPDQPHIVPLSTPTPGDYLGYGLTIFAGQHRSLPVVLHDVVGYQPVPAVSETRTLPAVDPYQGVSISTFVEQLEEASSGLIEPMLHSNGIGGEDDEQTENTVVGYRDLTDKELEKFHRLQTLADSLLSVLTPALVTAWDEADQAITSLKNQRHSIKDRLEQAEIRRLRKMARDNPLDRSSARTRATHFQLPGS